MKPFHILVALILLAFLFVNPVIALLVAGLLFAYDNFKPRYYYKRKDLSEESTRNSSMYMSPEEKLAYLKSSKWQSIRQSILDRDNHQCQHCGSTEHLEIHHINYYNLGDEHPSDLVTLCATCHNAIHDRLGYSRSELYPINVLDY